MPDMADIDTPTLASVSFARPDTAAGDLDVRRDGDAERAPVPVGPGRPAIVAPTQGSGGLLGLVSDYPISLDKVQAPPLRDETLARDRLLEWLQVKINRRVVLVLAEAGYGKTTLLADFTRRSRVRIAWYRLDHGDRDWLGFIAHLVAAFRIHEPDFAPATQSLIREAASANPTRDMVLNTFIRELGGLPAEPTVLVFDDFHLVDDSQDARAIVRELLARAPERLSIVLVSRTTPSLPFARLRARAELAELRTADLRFAPEETERLFRDTYLMPLESSVLAELSRRTEGWVASLQLVRAAVRDRNQTEIRAFVRSLSGAEGDLYDYLAEEVVGELAAGLQQFLMRASLLEIIEPHLGSVAAEIPPDAARRAIAEGEILGLFSRTGPSSRDHVRAHPLVRDFLQARLRRSVESDAIVVIHRRVAAAAEATDWRIAGHHYLAAGDLDDARRVLASSIETILATGGYAAAEELVTALPRTDHPDPNVLVVMSRLAQQRGHLRTGREFAEAAHVADPDSPAAALNLQAALMNSGDLEGSLAIAKMVEGRSDWKGAAAIARATRLVVETSVSGLISDAILALGDVLREFADLGNSQYAGVAHLSLGYLQYAQGRTEDVLMSTEASIEHLSATSASHELVSAHLLRAMAAAHAGGLDEGRREAEIGRSRATDGQGLEVALESSFMEVLYGDVHAAEAHLMRFVEVLRADRDPDEQALLILAHIHMAQGRLSEARSIVEGFSYGRHRSTVAMNALRLYTRAKCDFLTGAASATMSAQKARDAALAQGADIWASAASILLAASLGNGFESLEPTLESRPVVLTMSADVIAMEWERLGPNIQELVRGEATKRPERWRSALRLAMESGSVAHRFGLALLLDEVGAAEDIPKLRKLVRDLKLAGQARDLGRGLARRLSTPVVLEDLGRVRVRLGQGVVEGRSIRRKVLALLCYLATRSQMSATREEAIDALWPNLDPTTALNSLNQTVYFLRRVFEPEYQEDTSPGYLGQDGELIWLDTALVASRSQMCRRLIRDLRVASDKEGVLELARQYTSKFAIDFSYEDWASDYRDTLHASYLRVVEAAIRADIDDGEYDHGIEVAQLAADAEPASDDLQLSLVRLFRLSNSYAAAAEQYEVYARSQRDLGVEPEPFDAL